jgi:hypothetical protein
VLAKITVRGSTASSARMDEAEHYLFISVYFMTSRLIFILMLP